MKNKDEIIAFFTSGVATDAQKYVARAGYKEGYLTKRGKNFGGWKTRYFVLQGPSLEYYESVSYLILGPSPYPRRRPSHVIVTGLRALLLPLLIFLTLKLVY